VEKRRILHCTRHLQIEQRHAQHQNPYSYCETYALAHFPYYSITFSLKMVTAMSAKILEQLQYTTKLNPENQNYT
jgi:hypothetical protein